jgi:hypothetical protein
MRYKGWSISYKLALFFLESGFLRYSFQELGFEIRAFIEFDSFA